MELHVIDTGFFKLDGGAMFGVVPKTIWNRLNPADEKNLCPWAMRCLLVVSGDRKILIDTGLGDKQSEKFFSYVAPFGEGSLKTSIEALGYTYDDITDVLLSHLHFDHCGEAVSYDQEKNLIPTFPNATYWSNEAHWETACNPNAREKASFLKENFVPLQEAGKLKFLKDREELIPGLSVRFFDGHTKAMMVAYIEYKGRTLVYAADLLPSPHHIPMAYVMAYDVKPLVSMVEKEAFLKEALEKDFVLFFEHDPEIECCDLKMTERGIRADKTFKLAELT